MWHPSRFERKALQDLLNGLARISASVSESAAVELTSPHLALAAWVMAQPSTIAGADRRQFSILQSFGHSAGRQLKVVFVSRAFAT